MREAQMRPLVSAVLGNPDQLPSSYTQTPAGMQPTPYQQQQGVSTAAGTVISICETAPATFDEAGYTASSMVFLPIGEVTDMGSHGKTSAEITHKPIADRWVQKYKGSWDVGTKAVQMALDMDDAGQDLAREASDSDNDYFFKVAYPNGDADYMAGKVMSFTKTVSGVDTIVNATMNLSLSGVGSVGIVEVLAGS